MKHAFVKFTGLTSALCFGLAAFGAKAQTTAPVLPTGSPATVTAAPATGSKDMPYGASEVLKMYQGGIGKDVLLNYVNNTQYPFRLNADAIIALKSAGVPEDVTAAMIRRDGDLQRQAIALQQQYQQQMAMQQQQSPPPGSANAGINPALVAPQQQVVVPTTVAPVVDADPGYIYGDPYYPYYWGGPGVVIGGGWGWGWGGRGWGGYGYRGGFGGFHGGFGGVGGFHGGGGFGGHGGGFGGHGGGGGHR